MCETVKEKIPCKSDEHYKYTIDDMTVFVPRYSHKWILKDSYESFNTYKCVDCDIIRKVITK